MIYLVKNWRDFQHYKDRNPPWIKLHFSLLSSEDWVMLDDASRVLAVACMLVASKKEGQIDGSEAGLRYLQRVAYLKKIPDLTPLINCGFLVSASGCKQMLANARPEERRSTTEVLSETPLAPSNRLPDAADPPNGEKKNGNSVAYIPLVGGDEWGVSHEFAAELATLYPAVDVPQTLNEIRGWNLANPKKRKTARGVAAHINTWFQREQNRG